MWLATWAAFGDLQLLLGRSRIAQRFEAANRNQPVLEIVANIW